MEQETGDNDNKDQIKVQVMVRDQVKISAPPLPSSIRIDEERCCRICFQQMSLDEIFSPCSCKGANSYVHEKCLVEWAKKSQKYRESFQKYFYLCEICKEKIYLRVSQKLRCVNLKNVKPCGEEMCCTVSSCVILGLGLGMLAMGIYMHMESKGSGVSFLFDISIGIAGIIILVDIIVTLLYFLLYMHVTVVGIQIQAHMTNVPEKKNKSQLKQTENNLTLPNAQGKVSRQLFQNPNRVSNIQNKSKINEQRQFRNELNLTEMMFIDEEGERENEMNQEIAQQQINHQRDKGSFGRGYIKKIGEIEVQQNRQIEESPEKLNSHKFKELSLRQDSQQFHSKKQKQQNEQQYDISEQGKVNKDELRILIKGVSLHSIKQHETNSIHINSISSRRRKRQEQRQINKHLRNNTQSINLNHNDQQAQDNNSISFSTTIFNPCSILTQNMNPSSTSTNTSFKAFARQYKKRFSHSFGEQSIEHRELQPQGDCIVMKQSLNNNGTTEIELSNEQLDSPILKQKLKATQQSRKKKSLLQESEEKDCSHSIQLDDERFSNHIDQVDNLCIINHSPPQLNNNPNQPQEQIIT